jgi:hypothetical protein
MATKNRQHTIFINGEPYYTAQKSEEVLQMTYSGLRYQVLIGNIKSEIPKGRRQSYYKAQDVEQVAKDLQAFSLHRTKKPTKFERITKRSEIESIGEISQNVLSPIEKETANKTIDNRMKIIKRNPETYYMLKNENQVVGYTAMWPIKLGKINSLLAQTLPVEVPPDDIETFEDGKAIDIYINAMHVNPIFKREEKRFYGARLISGLAGVIENLGERGILIGTIAARSNMPEGIRLMKGAGFAEIESLTPERRTFIINIKESGSPFVMKYKEKLHKWQENHKATTAQA